MRVVHFQLFRCWKKKKKTTNGNKKQKLLDYHSSEHPAGTVNVRTRDNVVHGEYKIEDIKDKLVALRASKNNQDILEPEKDDQIEAEKPTEE